MTLNLFYEEPDSDRWLPFDRYPRQIVRRLVRGKPRIGGQHRVFLNLCAGLDKLGVEYRVNDYRYIQRHPDELACIIGKPHVLDKIPWKNPILFGTAVYSHPLDDRNLLNRLPVRKVLVPGEWMRVMCEPYWGDTVVAWPAGIDTDRWRPNKQCVKALDFLIYDKLYWDREVHEKEFLGPIRDQLKQSGLNFIELRYGHYRESQFQDMLQLSKAMIFLSAHETQGIAYQQALASGVPILAWNKGGFWLDPEFYPHRVKFEPVSSVPYWDERCGLQFENLSQFSTRLNEFWPKVRAEAFQPRDYILENLTLEKCAQDYLRLVKSCFQ